MEVHLTPEQQQELARLATDRGRDAETLAQEAITGYLEEEARFIAVVKRGDYLTHEQMGKRLERLFQS